MRESMIGLLGKRSDIHSYTRRHEDSPLATAIFGPFHTLSTRSTPLSYPCMKTLTAGSPAGTTSLQGAMPCPQAAVVGRTISLANAVLKGTNLICM